MKKVTFLSLILAIFLIGSTCPAVSAQDDLPAPGAERQISRKRPNLLEQLNLTSAQIQEIRRFNAEKKPLLRAAQDRLREANRNLDEAVYSDNINETEIYNRLKEVDQAQAEVSKIRLSNELAVRKILTNEQITKFRQLRERFAQSKSFRQTERRNREMNSDKRPAPLPRGLFKQRQRFPRPN